MPRHALPEQATDSVDAGRAIWAEILKGPDGQQPYTEEGGDPTGPGISDAPRRDPAVDPRVRSRQARPLPEEEERRPDLPRDPRGRWKSPEEVDARQQEDDVEGDVELEAEDDVEGQDDGEDQGHLLVDDDEELLQFLSNTKHRVKADGEELEVDYEELRKGYARQQYLTRRTQEAAAREREAEAFMQDLTAERETFRALTARLVERLQGEVAAAKPDPSLQKTNPVQYLVQQEAYREKQAELEAAQREQLRVQDANMRAMQAIRTSTLQREQELLAEKVPEWRADPDRASAELQELYDFAGSVYGWTEQDLAGVTDHRLILMLRDAARGRKAAESVKPVRRRKPGAARPGGSNPIAQRRQQQREGDRFKNAVERTRETGSRKDGLAAMKEYLRRTNSN